jgi:hypothetical protein
MTEFHLKRQGLVICDSIIAYPHNQ